MITHASLYHKAHKHTFLEEGWAVSSDRDVRVKGSRYTHTRVLDTHTPRVLDTHTEGSRYTHREGSRYTHRGF